VERAVDRRQLVIADLQPPCLPDPRERALDDPPDLAQATAVRRPPPLQALLVARDAVLPVPVQRRRLASSATPRLADRRDLVKQRQGLGRVVPVGPGDPDGQRGAPAVGQQVALATFLGPIRGVFAGEDPPKTAR